MKRQAVALLSLFTLTVTLWRASPLAQGGQQAAAEGKSPSTANDRVVISIDDEKMTTADVEGFIQALPPEYRAYYGGPGKHLLPQYLVRMKVLSAEAVKDKLEDQPDVARAIAIARQSILAEAARKYIEQSVPVSDQELREIYEKQTAQFEEVHIRHILIRSEDAALKSRADPNHPSLPQAEAQAKLEDIRKRILAGADFVAMAKQYSEDADTAAQGGDMGYINHDTALPPIAYAAYTLSAGQVSNVLTTPYGFEIIKVEDKRTPPLAQVKPLLESQVRQQKAQETVQHLTNQTKVVVDQGFFSSGAAKPAASAAPPGH